MSGLRNQESKRRKTQRGKRKESWKARYGS